MAVNDKVMVLVKPDSKWPQVEEASVVDIGDETIDVELLTGEEIGYRRARLVYWYYPWSN